MRVCETCGYYWQDPWEEYPRCHFEDDGFPAPCEEEEYNPPEYTDEEW